MARPPNVKILMRVVLHTQFRAGKVCWRDFYWRLRLFCGPHSLALYCAVFVELPIEKCGKSSPQKKKDDHNGEVFLWRYMKIIRLY